MKMREIHDGQSANEQRRKRVSKKDCEEAATAVFEVGIFLLSFIRQKIWRSFQVLLLTIEINMYN